MSSEQVKPITLPDGRKGFGIEVEFETVHEDWNVYELSNGTRLRVKTLLAHAFQIVDENGNPIYGDNGEPEYVVNTGFNVEPETLQHESEMESSTKPTEAGITQELQADGSYKWYAIDARTMTRVEIDPDQAWFWTPEWQAGEREVDEYLARGEVEEFDDMESFLDSLPS